MLDALLDDSAACEASIMGGSVNENRCAANWVWRCPAGAAREHIVGAQAEAELDEQGDTALCGVPIGAGCP